MRAPMVIVIVIVLVTYSLCERNFKVERGQMSMPNAQCSMLTYLQHMNEGNMQVECSRLNFMYQRPIVFRYKIHHAVSFLCASLTNIETKAKLPVLIDSIATAVKVFRSRYTFEANQSAL
jgi:hypothetical protein